MLDKQYHITQLPTDNYPKLLRMHHDHKIWYSMGWDGMGWDWMGWDGTGWDGMVIIYLT